MIPSTNVQGYKMSIVLNILNLFSFGGQDFMICWFLFPPKGHKILDYKKMKRLSQIFLTKAVYKHLLFPTIDRRQPFSYNLVTNRMCSAKRASVTFCQWQTLSFLPKRNKFIKKLKKIYFKFQFRIFLFKYAVHRKTHYYVCEVPVS